MPKFLCDYCDTHLNFDSQSGRKQHNRGRKHQENVRGYYAQYAAALAQANRDAAAAGMAPVTYGITLMPPSHTAGASLGASGGGGGRPVAQPFAPYPAPSRPPMGGGPPPHAGGGGGGFHSGPPAGGFHQGPPGGGFQGGYRGPPPPQMGGGMPQQQQQQHQGFGQSGMGMGGRPAPGGPGLPPPPFMGAGGGAGGLPPPPMGGRPAGPPMAGQLPPPQQQQQQQAPAAAAAAAGGAASKPFVNPDRMRALGLMDHR